MKAVIITKHGGPEKLIHSDIPVPEAGPQQVLVQMKTAGISL